MGMKGIEAVEWAIETVLSAGMAAEIAALNSEYDDDYTLSDIATYIHHEENLPASGYPAVVIEGMESVGRELWIEAEDTLHTIWLYVWVSSADKAALDRLPKRYVRAIKEILYRDQSLGGVAHALAFERAQFSPMLSKDEVYFKAARMVVHVLTEEVA